jgi:hypothetical protein
MGCNAFGLPAGFALTGGKASDYTVYLPTMDADGPTPKVLLADKGYDSDLIREDMKKRGDKAMISTRKNRLVQVAVDGQI